jgi:predicted ATPase/class 3 adenylate cyclase
MAAQTESGPPASARPTGTVTFLFSDIESSTLRWERDRKAMEPALARHDELMRATLEARGAYVFKTIGDAFCAAFAAASDAIAAALDAQHALAAADFSAVDGMRARMALHAGSAAERDGDYFGPTVNRVARLLAIGHGGQVLLSGACMELVRGELPPQCSLRDLGAHRLKDLAQPERVYQLIAPDLPQAFPELRSLDHLSNNLPSQLTSFVGREDDVAEIASLLQEHRLVTLIGSGGVGKTRASLQVAANLIDDFGDGVWLVELAPLTGGGYIPSTVAQVLDLKLASEGDPVENLVRAVKGKQTLLVFDNCEHLVEPAARVLAAILRGCPKVKVLASGRQALGISGEVTYRMPSLPVPKAIALFAERARGADSRFVLTDENTPFVADICRRLDGIPLAIELAAARVKILSPKQLRERLDERFRVLTGGDRSALPRHQTMRALIDWSYELLDQRERKLFRRLGIFVNGFALEGAVAVGSGDDIDKLDVFDVLASLVDKSLVLAEPQDDALRYGLLESTRAYASEKLDDAGERDLIVDRHLRYLRDRFAELWEQWVRTGRRTDLDATLQTELDDVRFALDGALVRSEVADGAELLANIHTSWQAIGTDAEGVARCEAYLAVLPADNSRLRARLLTTLSHLLGESGHKVRALEVATQAVEQARASGDGALLAAALCRYAQQSTFFGRFDDAEPALIQAEAIPGTSTNVRLLLLETRAVLSHFRGDLETAARTWGQLRKELRSLGNARGELSGAFNLAEAEHARGQTQRAVAIVRETLPMVRAGDDKGALALLLVNLAGYLAAVDDLANAVAAARESIGIHAGREPDHVRVAMAIEHLALAVALCGDQARAAILEGYTDAAFARHGFEREFTETTTHDRLTAVLRESLAPDALAQLTAEGAALTPEAAIALALEDLPV